jgi:hypothetical protein
MPNEGFLDLSCHLAPGNIVNLWPRDLRSCRRTPAILPVFKVRH